MPDKSDLAKKAMELEARADADEKGKKPEAAEANFRKAGATRDALAASYAGDGDHDIAATEYDQAAKDYGSAARLNQGEAKGREYEQNLQHQISELLKSADELRSANLPRSADDRRNAAVKIKTDYDLTHPDSKLEITTTGELKKT